NAGIIAYEPLDELDMAAWQRVIAVNMTGVWLGMKHAVPVMKRSGRGSIVNFSSIVGNAAVPGAHAYHATTAAGSNMTKNEALTSRSECHAAGIGGGPHWSHQPAPE